MPYKDASRRVEKYSKVVIPANVSAKFTAYLSDMVTLQQEQQSLIVAMETAVRTILDNNGIIGNFRIAYLNFARALFRAKGSQSDVALFKYADAEKAKWVALGLDADILDKIIASVIGTPTY